MQSESGVLSREGRDLRLSRGTPDARLTISATEVTEGGGTGLNRTSLSGTAILIVISCRRMDYDDEYD